jgi:hypothetical protein
MCLEWLRAINGDKDDYGQMSLEAKQTMEISEFNELWPGLEPEMKRLISGVFGSRRMEGESISESLDDLSGESEYEEEISDEKKKEDGKEEDKEKDGDKEDLTSGDSVSDKEGSIEKREEEAKEEEFDWLAGFSDGEEGNESSREEYEFIPLTMKEENEEKFSKILGEGEVKSVTTVEELKEAFSEEGYEVNYQMSVLNEKNLEDMTSRLKSNVFHGKSKMSLLSREMRLIQINERKINMETGRRNDWQGVLMNLKREIRESSEMSQIELDYFK